MHAFCMFYLYVSLEFASDQIERRKLMQRESHGWKFSHLGYNLFTSGSQNYLSGETPPSRVFNSSVSHLNLPWLSLLNPRLLS